MLGTTAGTIWTSLLSYIVLREGFIIFTENQSIEVRGGPYGGLGKLPEAQKVRSELNEAIPQVLVDNICWSEFFHLSFYLVDWLAGWLCCGKWYFQPLGASVLITDCIFTNFENSQSELITRPRQAPRMPFQITWESQKQFKDQRCNLEAAELLFKLFCVSNINHSLERGEETECFKR